MYCYEKPVISIRDKVIDTANTNVVGCLHSKLKSMSKFELQFSKNKSVLFFPSKSASPCEFEP